MHSVKQSEFHLGPNVSTTCILLFVCLGPKVKKNYLPRRMEHPQGASYGVLGSQEDPGQAQESVNWQEWLWRSEHQLREYEEQRQQQESGGRLLQRLRYKLRKFGGRLRRRQSAAEDRVQNEYSVEREVGETLHSNETWWRHDMETMMTSSNGNIFRVTGHLCGEFTSPRWIPLTKASDAELWCCLWSASEQTGEQIIETLTNWDAIVSLWRHCNGWQSTSNMEHCSFSVVRLYKLLNKQCSDRWYQTPWRSWGVSVINAAHIISSKL